MLALLVAFVGASLECTFALAHKMHKKCHIDFPLFALGADPSPCLFVCLFVCLFFSSTLSVVFCLFVKKYVIPLVGDERNHLTI